MAAAVFIPPGYFQNPDLLAGLGLVALPILIHLLNRFRYRRVRWAAIEFLLDSQQRNRRRIFLEQLFLLALRCLLVALAVALVARPNVRERFAALITDREMEHIVVLDDSYSMGERQGESTAFASGIGAIRRLGQALAERPGRHTLSLLRTSRIDTPDWEDVRMDQAQSAALETLVADWRMTFGAAGPGALGVAQAERRPLSPTLPHKGGREPNELPDDGGREPKQRAVLSRSTGGNDGNRSLYLVTDFRRRDWSTPQADGSESSPSRVDLVAQLRRLAAEGVQLYLVDAAPSGGQTNLTVEAASAALGIAATGIPFPLAATVRNRSRESLEQVNVTARVDGRPLPVRPIDRLEPGGVGKVEFELVLDQPGVHELSLELPADALAADNRRFVGVDLPERIEVLLVDGGRERTDSRFLALALAPGGPVRTGLLPVVRGPEALTALPGSYRAVLLLNVPQIEPERVRTLVGYVEGGGGLAVFLGDQVDAAQYNAAMCHRETGLFRAPLQAPWDAPTGIALGPDVRPERHPIFRVFEGERNPFLDTVRVTRRYRLADEKPAIPTEVVARWRSGAPLVLESRWGRGRALLFLTTAGPDWNTWARNPSFVVAMLEMVRYLCEPAGGPREGLVGEPWEVELPAGYRRTTTVRAPASDGSKTTETIEAATRGVGLGLVFGRTALPGVYELQTTRVDGTTETAVMAYNVDPAEGDLDRVGPEQLAQWLAGVEYHYLLADELGRVDSTGALDPRDWLILALVVLLVFEQYWALRLGYHTR